MILRTLFAPKLIFEFCYENHNISEKIENYIFSKNFIRWIKIKFDVKAKR